MSNVTPTIDVQEYIDSHPISPWQILIIFLAFLVVAVEGFDTAAIGYVAPSIVRDWGISKAALGPVMGALLAGSGLGTLISGGLADRFGRRRVLLASISFFGIFCGVSALTNNVSELLAWRFLTGLGLGAAMPNAITISSEFAPARIRSLAVNAMFCGYPVGLILGGPLSAWLIPTHGWRSVLVVGAVSPLVLASILYWVLPESPQFLVLRKKANARIAAILERISGAGLPQDCEFTSREATSTHAKASGPAVLLSKDFRAATAFLWASYFMCLLVYYQLTSWLPTMLTGIGFSISEAALVTAIFPFGGIAGNLVVAYAMDRLGAVRVVTGTFLVAAVFLLLTRLCMSDKYFLFASVFFSGMFVSSATTSMSPVATALYPTQTRATGVAWMLGVGRIGAVVGALVGGFMAAAQLRFEDVMSLLAVPEVIAAISLYFLGKVAPGVRRNAASTPGKAPVHDAQIRT